MESTISAAPQISIDREKTLRSHRRYWVLRRAQDIVFSLLALILLAPLALLISLAIVLDSPGDGAIFRQRRVGRNGKLFWLYKFRTMCPDAEEQLNELLSQNQMDGPVFKIKDDPRITRVGRFLRKTSLDELPQLLNVLQGDMSIVGPRPALPREVELYSDYQRQRLYVTPGLSCYWQIAPHRNEMSFDEWMALDLKYIQERSFWVDWKIIFLTVRAMLMKYGE
jgi:lipopolysaccharide/colanic/teichoic acid biosynthesis glycosyltransferase